MSFPRQIHVFSKTRLLLLMVMVCFAGAAFPQSGWKTDIVANFGCNVFLNYSRAQKFPGVRMFAALSVVAVKNNRFTLHYGPSLSIYSRTMGANLNPLVGDIQIDFTNTFSVGYGGDERMNHYKPMRTLHNGDFYNLVTSQRYAFFLSTNFLLNNHRRHQVLGSATATVDNFSVNYHNAGVPFGGIGLADGFDRYWTGGGTMFIHNSKGYNAVEFGYDQFTGYQPLLYELANIIGINVPLYNPADSTFKDKRVHLPNNFNTSMYQLKIGMDQFTSIDVGFVGAMIDRKGRFWGVQDWIHLKGHYPFHPNKDKTRFFMGGSYNNLKTIEP